MRKQPIYDLPLRFFHWVFAALFVAAFTIVKVYEEGTETYTFHMIFGLVLGLATLLRVVWGFIGSEPSRFASFPLSPVQLVNYFRNVLNPSQNQFRGHNPASSWVSVGMFLAALGLAVTGILMGQELGPDYLEDLHEWLADAFIVLVIAHVVGLVLHLLVHRDRMELTMIVGPATKQNTLIAWSFILILSVFGFQLVRGYDVSKGTLSVFGITMGVSDPIADSAVDSEAESK